MKERFENKTNGTVLHHDLEEIPEPDVKTAPDGGWGWIVCFACFMTHVLMDGPGYSIGIFFVELLEYFKKSKEQTAWIVSLGPAMTNLVGPVAAVLVNRYGCRRMAVIGAVMFASSFILSSFAPNIYFLYFSLGLLAGTGNGLLYLTAIVSVSKYFDKRRALATGLGVCGAGVGTFIFGPITRLLIDEYTWKGAMLIQGGLVLNCIACGLVYLPLDIAEMTDKDHRLYVNTDIEFVNTDIELHDNDLVNNKNSTFENPGKCVSRNDSLQISDKLKKSPEYTNRRPKLRASCFDIKNDPETNKNIIAIKDCPVSESDEVVKRLLINTNSDGLSDYIDNTEHVNIAVEGSSNKSIMAEIYTQVKSSFNFGIFKMPVFCLFVSSNIILCLAYRIPFIYLPDKAKSVGVTDYNRAWLVSTVGITNTVGRVVFGYISDLKCVNRLILYCTAVIICGVSTSLGPLLESFETLFVYSVLFGVFSGVAIALLSVILVDVVGIETMTDGIGVLNFFSGVTTLIGAPFMGWLFDITGSYNVPFVVSGILLVLSGGMLYFVPCVKKHKP